MGQDRVGVVALRGDVDLDVVGVDRQPRLPGGEAGGRAVVPLHRRPRVVTSACPQARQHLLGLGQPCPDGMRPVAERLDVAEVVDRGERVVRHPDLLTLVDVRRPPVQVQHGRQHLGRLDPVHAVVAEPGHHPRLVVVVPVEAVPADVGEPGLPAPQRRLEVQQPQRPHVPLVDALVEPHVLELEDHVDLAAGRVGEQPRVVDRHTRHLPDGQVRAVAAGEHLTVHLLQELVDPRSGRVVLEAVGVQRTRRRVGVLQRRRLGDVVDDVHAEAVDPAVEPPPHHRVDGLPHLRVLPVEVGLLAREQVQVVLARRRVELPRRTGEGRGPVGRLGARRTGLHALTRRPPPVPVALRVVPARARRHEPRVLVGGVVDDEVHDEAHAAAVEVGEQGVEVLERAEHRLDVLVVGDVVAVVVHRRRVDRRQPQHVDAEVLQVVQPRAHAGEVADAVTVAVREAARVHLVHHGAAPPRVVLLGIRLLHVVLRRSSVHGGSRVATPRRRSATCQPPEWKAPASSGGVGSSRSRSQCSGSTT